MRRVVLLPLLIAVAMLASAHPVAAGSPPVATASRSIDAAAPTASRTSLALTARYIVRLTLRYGAGTLSADETIVVRNTSPGPIERLELNTVAARLGRLHVRSATVDGRAVATHIDDMTLHVPLGRTLPVGGETRVRLTFDAVLRTGTAGSDWMFTRANRIVNLYRWLPWISRARPFDRPSFGLPFLTPVSPRVELTVTTDRPLVIATGATRTAASGLTQTFVATNVRDVALAASPEFQVTTGLAGDTRIRVLGRTGFPRSTILAEARQALAALEARLGAYPYAELHLVQGAADWIAVAAPGTVWLQRDLAGGSIDDVLTHEIAHQWFYVLVGSDTASQPWAHEGTAEFMERSILGTFASSRCATGRLDLSIYEYTSSCFHPIVYVQGANFLEQVRRRVGSTAFWKGMRAYIARYRLRSGGTPQLLSMLDAQTPQDLVPLFRSRFPRYF